MSGGYVKYYRSSISNPLYTKPLVWHFWEYCLLKARKFPKEIDFNGEPFLIERGCFIMSLSTASKKTGLTEQNIRTAIKTLSNHGMIEKSTELLTKQATYIKVVKFEQYQCKDDELNEDSNEVTTEYQQGNDEVPTINKKGEEGKKKVKKDPTQKKYTKEFDKLWIDYKNSKGSKERTFKNYKKTMSLYGWVDDQVYRSCLNYQNEYFNENGKYEFMYQLSNLVGENYRDILPEYLDKTVTKEVTADIDPIEIARGYK